MRLIVKQVKEYLNILMNEIIVSEIYYILSKINI